MPFYTAFSLNFQSDFPLPELLPGSSVPDVFIRHGNLGKVPDTEGPIRCERADAHEALLSWGRVGLALIRSGQEVLVTPAPGVHEDALRLFLSGAVMGVLLHQRGLTVLHASAVLVNGQVVGFIGDKGAGKSSTAAALCARGHALITDDLLAIRYDEQGSPRVLFGYPQLKLWPDTAQTLGMDLDQLSKVRPEIEKRAHRPLYPELQGEYPLKRIYALGIGDAMESFSISARTIFFLLMRNLYISRFGKMFHQPEMRPLPFEQIGVLAQSVPICGLKRRVDLSALPEIAKYIEEAV